MTPGAVLFKERRGIRTCVRSLRSRLLRRAAKRKDAKNRGNRRNAHRNYLAGSGGPTVLDYEIHFAYYT